MITLDGSVPGVITYVITLFPIWIYIDVIFQLIDSRSRSWYQVLLSTAYRFEKWKTFVNSMHHLYCVLLHKRMDSFSQWAGLIRMIRFDRSVPDVMDTRYYLSKSRIDINVILHFRDFCSRCRGGITSHCLWVYKTTYCL